MHTMPTPNGVAPAADISAPPLGSVRVTWRGPLLTYH